MAVVIYTRCPTDISMGTDTAILSNDTGTFDTGTGFHHTSFPDHNDSIKGYTIFYYALGSGGSVLKRVLFASSMSHGLPTSIQ